MKRRAFEYRKFWGRLISLYGRCCFYWHDEIATTIDHVIPWTYDHDDTIENLVPACALCNALASDKNFDDVEQKRQYILRRRDSRKLRRAICVDCFLPYEYRVTSPSLFLCAECYDREYGTAKSETPTWQRWLHDLEAADIIPEAHAVLRANADKFKSTDRAGRVAFLVDAYDGYYAVHSSG